MMQRGRVRHLFVREMDTEEPAHCIAVIDGIFNPFLGKVEPVLHEVHAEHDLNVFRLAAARIVVVVRADDFLPLRPGDDGIHGIKEFFSTCNSAPMAIFNIRKSLLLVHKSASVFSLCSRL